MYSIDYQTKVKNTSNNSNSVSVSLCKKPTSVGDLCTLYRIQTQAIIRPKKKLQQIAGYKIGELNVVANWPSNARIMHMVLSYRKSKTLLSLNAHFSHVIFREINSATVCINRES